MSIPTHPRDGYLREGLNDLQNIVTQTTKEYSTCANLEASRTHMNEIEAARHNETTPKQDIREEVSTIRELSHMMQQERKDNAAGINALIDQMKAIAEENHRLLLSLSERTFQELGEEQRKRHAELLTAIRETRKKR